MPLQILLVVLFTLGNLPEGIHAFTLAQRVSCAGAALFVLPSLTFLSFVLENGMAVLFPAWVLVDRGAPAGASSRGIESMGLGIVTTGGRMIALVFLLIPATIVGGVVFAAGYPVVNVGAIAAGGLAAAVTLFGETELLLAWFGSRLESLDPATENI